MADARYADLLPKIVAIAERAGKAIMEIYAGDDFGKTEKADRSPLTQADLASHECILHDLRHLTPAVPALSEESENIDYERRRSWQTFWLIDPLDGTKEFLKRNDEFTVNIALIDHRTPVLGVVHAPALDLTYFAATGCGAFKQQSGRAAERISARDGGEGSLKIIVSRSHSGPEIDRFLEHVPGAESVRLGSSLKFCAVAEGTAHLYPRFGATSEWDTAAAHCVVNEAGGHVTDLRGRPLTYNKPDIINPFFMVRGARDVPWMEWV